MRRINATYFNNDSGIHTAKSSPTQHVPATAERIGMRPSCQAATRVEFRVHGGRRGTGDQVTVHANNQTGSLISLLPCPAAVLVSPWAFLSCGLC